MDDEKHEQYMRNMFIYPKERTDIASVLPAKDRIKQYKCRTIKHPQTAIGGRNTLAPAKSASDFKIMPASAKDSLGKDVLGRPTTAGFS